MKKILASSFLFLPFIFYGCAGLMMPTKVTSTSPQTVAQTQQQPAVGPKARVAVMSFENKSGVNYQASIFGGTISEGDPIGNGMTDQVVTALVQTNRFIVLERQAVQDVLKEQELGASGRVKRETAAEVGEIEGAEFLIYGSVTEFSAQQAEISGGIGAEALGAVLGGGLISILAKKILAVGMSQDHVAIDIRLVDAKTGRIVNATSVEGKPRDLDGDIGGIFGGTLVGLSGSYKTPIQKAIRACIINAVNWVGENAFVKETIKSSEIAPPVETPAEEKR